MAFYTFLCLTVTETCSHLTSSGHESDWKGPSVVSIDFLYLWPCVNLSLLGFWLSFHRQDDESNELHVPRTLARLATYIGYSPTSLCKSHQLVRQSQSNHCTYAPPPIRYPLRPARFYNQCTAQDASLSIQKQHRLSLHSQEVRARSMVQVARNEGIFCRASAKKAFTAECGKSLHIGTMHQKRCS